MTKFEQFKRKILTTNVFPVNPVAGDYFFRNGTNEWVFYDGSEWIFFQTNTTTSTSTSTTSTSSSTTTTSSSTSTSISTSTSTSTSTTTTL